MNDLDKKRLTARAGRITFELIDEKRTGLNIRVQIGGMCWFRPRSKDV